MTHLQLYRTIQLQVCQRRGTGAHAYSLGLIWFSCSPLTDWWHSVYWEQLLALFRLVYFFFKYRELALLRFVIQFKSAFYFVILRSLEASAKPRRDHMPKSMTSESSRRPNNHKENRYTLPDAMYEPERSPSPVRITRRGELSQSCIAWATITFFCWYYYLFMIVINYYRNQAPRKWTLRIITK